MGLMILVIYSFLKLSCQCLFKAFIKKKTLFKVNFKIKYLCILYGI